MAERLAQAIATATMLGALMTVAGCSTAPARFYTLGSAATADGTPAASYAVLVGPVFVPGSVDRPEFVVQIAPNQVEIDEFNRWAAPLGDAIARAIAGDLAVQLGTSDVAVAPLANFRADYRVSINVQRFESVRGKSVVIDALWTVNKIAGGEVRSGRSISSETPRDDSFDALAAAHSRALVAVSADIAAAIRASAGTGR
jgi:uncharacterized lipoprotein YmbA